MLVAQSIQKKYGGTSLATATFGDETSDPLRKFLPTLSLAI